MSGDSVNGLSCSECNRQESTRKQICVQCNRGGLRTRAANPDFALRCNDKATGPAFQVFVLDELANAHQQLAAAGLGQPDQEYAVVCSRLVLVDIRKVQILCDQQAAQTVLAKSSARSIRNSFSISYYIAGLE